MAPSNSQIDRLGDRLRREGPADDADRLAYDEYRASFSEPLREVQQRLGSALFSTEEQTSRLKTLESAQAKLRRGPFKLSRIDDIGGCRFVVTTLGEQDDAIETCRREFADARLKDRRIQPSFGYRAAHVLVSMSGRRIEIQLRTAPQNRWANFTEELSEHVGIGVKYGTGPSVIQDGLLQLSSVLAELDKNMTELVDAIFLFTAIHTRDLGKGASKASAADFAEYEQATREAFEGDLRSKRGAAAMIAEERIVQELREQARAFTNDLFSAGV